MITPGLVSITFRQLTPEQIVRLVCQAKLKAIEWGGDIHVPHGDLKQAQKIRNLTKDNGLTVAAYGSYYRAGHIESHEVQFEPVLETAIALGAPCIRIWPGKIGSAEANPNYRQKVTEDIRRVSDLASKAGIKIALEYHANTLTDTIESAKSLISNVNHPNLGTLWQPPNGWDFEDCKTSLKSILPYLINVHVFHWWPTNKDRHPLKNGLDRWSAYLSILANSKKDCCALLEFVQNDSLEQFLQDAVVLQDILSAL